MQTGPRFPDFQVEEEKSRVASYIPYGNSYFSTFRFIAKANSYSLISLLYGANVVQDGNEKMSD